MESRNLGGLAATTSLGRGGIPIVILAPCVGQSPPLSQDFHAPACPSELSPRSGMLDFPVSGSVTISASIVLSLNLGQPLGQFCLCGY